MKQLGRKEETKPERKPERTTRKKPWRKSKRKPKNPRGSQGGTPEGNPTGSPTGNPGEIPQWACAVCLQILLVLHRRAAHLGTRSGSPASGPPGAIVSKSQPKIGPRTGETDRVPQRAALIKRLACSIGVFYSARAVCMQKVTTLHSVFWFRTKSSKNPRENQKIQNIQTRRNLRGARPRRRRISCAWFGYFG